MLWAVPCPPTTQQVEFLVRQFAVLVEVRNPQILAPRQLEDPRGDALDVMDVLLRPGALVILVEVFAVRADIHVEMVASNPSTWSPATMACLVAIMQQMEEQYSLPQVESREPTHGSRRCAGPRGRPTGG